MTDIETLAVEYVKSLEERKIANERCGLHKKFYWTNQKKRTRKQNTRRDFKMNQKMEIIPWDAREDSVCPVDGETDVIVWLGSGVVIQDMLTTTFGSGWDMTATSSPTP